jgi:hypothetical protein
VEEARWLCKYYELGASFQSGWQAFFEIRVARLDVHLGDENAEGQTGDAPAYLSGNPQVGFCVRDENVCFFCPAPPSSFISSSGSTVMGRTYLFLILTMTWSRC